MSDLPHIDPSQQEPLPFEVADEWGEPVRESWQDRPEDDIDDRAFDADSEPEANPDDDGDDDGYGDPDDEFANPDQQERWDAGSAGPRETGTEGADQVLSDDFRDPSDTSVDDRKPVRDAFGPDDAGASEQGNRAGDDTPLETDTPSQGFAPTDENWGHQAEREADRRIAD